MLPKPFAAPSTSSVTPKDSFSRSGNLNMVVRGFQKAEAIRVYDVGHTLAPLSTKRSNLEELGPGKYSELP